MFRKVFMAMALLMALSSAAIASDPQYIGDIKVTDTIDVQANPTATATATGGNANATGGTATVENSGNSKVENSGNSDAKSTSSLTVLEQREFIAAPAGPNIAPVIVIPETKKCLPVRAEILSLAEIDNMNNGSFLEKKGGWWHGLFTNDVHESIRFPYDGELHKGPIEIMGWGGDPSKGFPLYPGDKKLGTVNCDGHYGFPLDATLGKCVKRTYELTNATSVYACYVERIDPHSSGTAYSGSGAASAIPGSGDVAAAGSVAGTFGTSVAYGDKAYDVEVIAVAIAPKPVIAVPPPANFTPAAPRPAAPACDASVYAKIVSELEESTFERDGVKWCKFPGFNNQTLRYWKGVALTRWYFCELSNGKKITQLLDRAEYEFGVAERDFNNGRELARGQKFGDKPKGVLTPTLPHAQALDYRVHYDWALVVRALRGRGAEIDFARANKLKYRGDGTMPDNVKDLK